MTKAEKLLSKECMRYIAGECRSTHCLIRGGYNLKNRGPFNPEIATCEYHEAIIELKVAQRNAEIVREDFENALENG